MLKRGSKVRISLNGSYRYYLDGLEGEVVAVYHSGPAVRLGSPPIILQNIVSPGGATGPVNRDPIYIFQFNEVIEL